MVNVPKRNLSPLPAGKYRKLTQRSTAQGHRADKGKRGLEAEQVRAIRALCGMRSENKLEVGKQQETDFVSNEQKKKWIEDYVETKTAVATKQVEDAETAINPEQDDMRNAEKAGLTTTKPETQFREMLNAIRYSLSALASSENGKDGDDKDEEEDNPAGGKLSNDDKPI